MGCNTDKACSLTTRSTKWDNQPKGAETLEAGDRESLCHCSRGTHGNHRIFIFHQWLMSLALWLPHVKPFSLSLHSVPVYKGMQSRPWWREGGRRG